MATSTESRTIPPFTEEHEALRESIRSFVEREIRPHAPEWEKAEEFPRELFTRMGELGFLGLKYPERYGGQGDRGRLFVGFCVMDDLGNYCVADLVI